MFSGCTSEKPVILDNAEKAESITIGGSASVYPIVKALATAFEEDYPGKEINFGAPGHSGPGIKGVNREVFEIAAVSRTLNKEEKKHGLLEFWFARDALVFATHPSVKLDGLPADKIRDIYYGRIKNWKEVGGPDHQIIVIDRSEESSPKVMMYKKSFLDKKREITDRAIVLEYPADMDTALLTTPYSIGYTSLASIINENYDLNILSIDNIEPIPANVKDGSYVLSRPQGLVTKDVFSGLAKEFIGYILSEKGRSIIEKKGYAPFE
jgi:phosphate transport system substrate-binding protein